MKLIVAGGRDLHWNTGHADALALWMVEHRVELVVSGGCLGADMLGEAAACRAMIQVKRVHADWKRLGRAAGPLRNRLMAELADTVLLLPGGRGTASMAEEARAAGLKIYDNRNSGGWQR